MRALLSVALGLAGALAQADAAAQNAAPRPLAVSEQRVEKPAKEAETQRKPLPALAVLFTDDADSTRLPAFASRTTPLPTRLFRVGVEWSF